MFKFRNDRLTGARKRRRVRNVAVAVLLAGTGVALAAELVTVQVEQLSVKPGKGGLGKPVALVHKSDALTVLAHEGDWLHVRAPNGAEGYVKQAALTARPFAAGKVNGDASTSGANASLAAKGLEPAASDFARQRNYNPAPLNRVLDLRYSISAEEYQQFQSSGHVGAAAGTGAANGR